MSKRTLAENGYMENGKLPPQAIEIETAVLGACLLGGDAINIVKGIIKPDTFYKDQNGRIYSAILSLVKKSINVDMLTVVQELKKMGELEVVGGAHYIAKLTERIASDANIEQHARILVQLELKRECIRLGTCLVRDGYADETDVFEIIDKNIQQSFEMINFKTTNKIMKVGDVHKQTIETMHEVQQSGKPSGVPSGIEYLDKLTNGWQKSDLIIMAARPGMSKTALALQLCKNASLNDNIPTAFFSLEMSKEQIMGRLQASESYIEVSKIITNNLSQDEILAIDRDCLKLSKMPMYIDDTAGISIFEFKQKAKKLVIENGVKLIVVDYLQLMTADVGKGNREQEISAISRGLKQTAKELKVPIIALAQLSRSVETRGGAKKPMLSDLRESGAIEQDADMIIFPYRPEYYGLMEDYEYFDYRLTARELLMIIIAKHRNGALGEIPCKFKGRFMRIDNYRLEADVSSEKIDEPDNGII